ncbi:hypothetical protein GPECTOR_107g162 [Gonium pectorale]|uniref:Interferon-related developmental regulator N-terminal domain-containing protein n=1 Tax=Gonium pectorale TaxID=33097 RepID=A0A150FZL1_GONPE|nr:hypothetical protein GPECTOR_107g162 [Gonium pectorale]|eukprot:KXZ43017.1 hypothetical protein GPECTOR_107g162 [Gonium pectorale]
MGRRRANAAAAASCLELASLDRRNGGSASPSTASVCSAFSYLDNDDDIQVDDFERRLDALFEKRGSTREKSLEALAVMLRVDYRDRDCVAHSETLTSRCLASLKRGGPVEASLASQLLGLHVLTLGQPNEGLFQELRPELERSAGGGGAGAVSVQVAALEALALAAFVLCEDEEGTLGVMERLRGMWAAKGDVKARAAAVRCWSFLLTTLSGPLPRPASTAALASLATLLRDEGAVEMRLAAGGAVAVLQAAGGDADGDVGDDDDVLLAAAEAGEVEGADGGQEEDEEEEEEDELGEVVERMQQLAANKGERGWAGGRAYGADAG